MMMMMLMISAKEHVPVLLHFCDVDDRSSFFKKK